MSKEVSVPSFVVAGTQKAATTWLYECFNEHPEVHVPTIKELHYFCDPDVCGKSRRALGFDWYQQQFACNDNQKVRGELSIDYMYYPEIPSLLAKLNPELKVLFVLRDPIDRAYSAYWMSRRNHVNYPPFAEFLNEESDFVARGFYHRQIERYRACFPDEQIFIRIYEDIAADPGAFLSEVFEFLNVDPQVRPPSMVRRVAATRALNPTLSTFLYSRASRLLKIRPVLWLWRQVRRRQAASAAKAGDKGNGGGTAASRYEPMTASDRDTLRRIYREENERLFDLLGRRIAQWDI